MKIKDVEKLVGITKANIRYYEEEGLITPDRSENNYREYTKENIRQLQRIKTLRLLGISIADIRRLCAEEVTLEEVMHERLEQIAEEEKDLHDVKKVCTNLLHSHTSFDAVDEKVLKEGLEYRDWRKELEWVRGKDIQKEMLTQRQLNFNIAWMLGWGYFLNVLTTPFLGDRLLENLGVTPVLFICAVLSFVCYCTMYMVKSVRGHMMIFHICALILSPFLRSVYCFAAILATWSESFQELPEYIRMNDAQFAKFWICMVIYVFLLYFVSCIWEQFFSKARYVVVISVGYTVLMGVNTWMIGGVWYVSGSLMIFMTLYVGLNWFHTCEDATQYSRYYAVSNCSRIMNIGGVLQTMIGKSRGLFR